MLPQIIESYGWFVFAWGSMGSALGLVVAFHSRRLTKERQLEKIY